MDALAVQSDQTSRAPTFGRPAHWWLLIGVAAAYYIGCLAGFALRFPQSGISFLWPPTAVLTSVFLLTKPGVWPGVLASTFAAHAVVHTLDGVPAVAWPVLFVGNSTQALLAAYLMRRYAGGTEFLSDARRTLAYIASACIAAALSSVLPSFVYASMGWAAEFFQAWRARTISNIVATLTLVPTFVLGWQYLRGRPRVKVARLAEFAAVLTAILAALSVTNALERPDLWGLALALYAPVPFLLWATVRFGGAGLSAALVWTIWLTISAVMRGGGPFEGRTPIDTVVAVQLFIAANAIPMMVIAGLLEQNRREHRALLDVEQQNKAILRTIPDLLFVQTREGLVEQCYLGSSRDDLVPSPPAVVGAHVSDVLPEPLAGIVAASVRGATADAPSVVECTQKVDGEPRRYEARFIAVDPSRVLTIVRDITERWRAETGLREARERYALATDAGGIGVWEMNPATGAVHIEGRLAQALGYEDHEVGGSLGAWEELMHPDDRETVHQHLMSLVAGTTDVFDEELRMFHKDGSHRWFSSQGAVTEKTQGRPSRIVGTYVDVTARKEAERALANANEALARSGRSAAFAQLSASIAHELNQPLTALATNATTCLHWLESGTASETTLREALADMVRDTSRASQIIERTREMFANRPVRKTALDLNDVVRGILEIAKSRVRDSDVRFEIDLARRAVTIVADEIQLQQVLLNLIVNGMDSMKEVNGRSRTIRIRVRSGKRHAAVAVRDAGHGFGPDGAGRVFDPFYTTKPSGTGLGLTISRSIVEAHGGSLSALANRDEGATFRLKLPLSEPPVADVRKVDALKRVLIVDDNDDLRLSLRRLIGAWGHQVAVATDGLNALSVAETFRPQFAIVDLSLPDMSGLELARRLRKAQSTPTLHLVALTAFRDDELRRSCLNGGFDTFLTKPEGITDLEGLLRKTA